MTHHAVVAKLRPGAIESGMIVDMQGNELGRHDGIINFTIGQATSPIVLKQKLCWQASPPMMFWATKDTIAMLSLLASKRLVRASSSRPKPTGLFSAFAILLSTVNATSSNVSSTRSSTIAPSQPDTPSANVTTWPLSRSLLSCFGSNDCQQNLVYLKA